MASDLAISPYVYRFAVLQHDQCQCLINRGGLPMSEKIISSYQPPNRAARVLYEAGWPAFLLTAVITIFGGFAIVGIPMVLIYWAVTRVPAHELGLSLRRNWAVTILGGIALGIAMKLLMKAVVLPGFGYADDPNGPFVFLEGNLDEALKWAVFVIWAAGFGEELIFRGFLIGRLSYFWERFGKLGTLGAMLVSAGIFGAMHSVGQGEVGVVNAGIGGIMFASIYVLSGRNLWLVAITHASFDLFSIWMFYTGTTEAVSRSIFG